MCLNGASPFLFMMLYDDENQIKIKLGIGISTFNMVVNNLDGQLGLKQLLR